MPLFGVFVHYCCCFDIGIIGDFNCRGLVKLVRVLIGVDINPLLIVVAAGSALPLLGIGDDIAPHIPTEIVTPHLLSGLRLYVLATRLCRAFFWV